MQVSNMWLKKWASSACTISATYHPWSFRPLDLLECWFKLFKLKVVKIHQLYFELESTNWTAIRRAVGRSANPGGGSIKGSKLPPMSPTVPTAPSSLKKMLERKKMSVLICLIDA